MKEMDIVRSNTQSAPGPPDHLGAGPLSGVRVIEIAGIGPVTFCGMLLANLGAEVVRIGRPATAGGTSNPAADGLAAHRVALTIDLRSDTGREALFGLCKNADVLIEGMRAGVMERLGIGPGECLQRNPRLVFGRVSGFGQHGPLAQTAGHDINYLALSGVLWMLGDGSAPPKPPLNLVGDYGGGAMMLAFGVACALVERSVSGRGQVVDTSILQGTTHLASLFYYARAGQPPGTPDNRDVQSVLGAAPWYSAYETADGGYMSVGSVEAPFYQKLLEGLGLEGDLPDRMDRANWPTLRGLIADAFRSRTRTEWERVFEGSDACVTPVLSPSESIGHTHNAAIGLFTAEASGGVPDSAPTFSRTPGRRPRGPAANQRLDDLLAGWQLTPEQRSAIRIAPPVSISPPKETALLGRSGTAS